MRLLSQKSILILLILYVLAAPRAAGQASVQVTGKFLLDSIKIGEQVPFTLTATYPSEKTLLFPDSTFTFSGFELDYKIVTPTITANGISYDSAVYVLTTFEIDPVLYLRIPAFEISDQDSIIHYSATDSIFIRELVTELPPDTVQLSELPLKSNTAYEPVNFLLNYPVLAIAIGAVILLVIAVWIFFGKKIIRYFKLRRLQKLHTTFLGKFEDEVRSIEQRFSRERTESTVSIWKKYMEQLESTPYTKLTTQETELLTRDHALGNILKQIDRVIYGRETAVTQSLVQLRGIAEARFQNRVKEIEHGR